MNAAQHHSSGHPLNRTIVIIITVVVAVLVVAGIAFGILTHSRSAQTATNPTTSEQQNNNNNSTSTSNDDTAKDNDDSQQIDGDDQSQSNQQDQPGQQQSTSTDIPTVLQQADSACNPHTTFNAENPTQESLIVDQATRSLTLMSGAQSNFTTYDCIAKQLQIPTDVTAEIESKQDQPDQKSFTWNGLTGTWSYNVNSGLQLYIVGQ
ncbi:hypothetical protein D2E25_0548 [Bifidobacterium goeldii]|uniref:Uncharacterized protein n=1 Tax=Bifidobacterium goeldii TaxID=2306975 RepID=A0A430FN32_9BIFI|nr:hypothetical protein [Bifidobacterium goeldii]RSX54240.1 hypothetical protein D2E25_0548 [Bifidobacterium goeldii]